MAITVLTNASVVYNSVDLSDHVRSVIVDTSYDQVDISAMGNTHHAFTPGLGVDKITIEFYQDFAFNKVDQVLSPLVGSAAGAVLVVKPNNTAVSSVNPSYTMTGSPYTYMPLNGQIGNASTTSVEFSPAAGSSIVRGIT